MAAVHAILTLYRLGWSQRQIAAKLGIHRATVSRYVHSPPAEAHSATNPMPGSEVSAEAIAGAKPATNPIPGSEAAAPSSCGRGSGPESLCEPFRAVIEQKLQPGLTGHDTQRDGRTFPRYTVRVQKSYRDKSGTWQTTEYYDRDDLPHVAMVTSKAFEFISLRESDDGADQIPL